MYAEISFTKENLDTYLGELAKEFRKLNGRKMPAEIILVGGAAVLINYGFREKTYDIDAVILASSVMKEAINHVGDKMGLPNGWLNTDFKRTKSFSDKLAQVSVYYKTLSNVLTIRTIAAEYLIAMKLMSGRRYKNDLSDIAGILWEHKKNETPVTRAAIEKAVDTLYGSWAQIPDSSMQLIKTAFNSDDYESLYVQYSESELQAKKDLLEFERDFPDPLKGESIESVLEKARKKRENGSY